MGGGHGRSRLTPYIVRLLDDDYIQDQISEAFTSLHRGSRRAKGQSPTEALKDRRLRRQLRDAAGSLTAAARALQAPQRSKRHLLRRVLAMGAATGGAVFLWRRFSSNATGKSNG